MPDFVQANFAEAPQLDNLRIEPPRRWLTSFASSKAVLKGDGELPARWRALKRLAVEAHDHDRELRFFKGELQSRRWALDKPWRAVFWLTLVYAVLSDYGRRVSWPLAWWLIAMAVFASIYLSQHIGLTQPDMPRIVSAQKQVAAIATDKPTRPLNCFAGAGEPIAAAVDLSVRNAFIFAGTASSAKLNQDYACLYGISAPPSSGASPLATALRVHIPYWVGFATIAQRVISAILIFLILLALRNRFRIK